MLLSAGALACHSSEGSKANITVTQSETRIVGAVAASTRKGGMVTAGVHSIILSNRRLPPDEAVIRAVLTSAQAMIRDSVTSPATLAAAIAGGRDGAVLTRYASLANPVPSYVISRSHFTWVTIGANIRLTNDQCADPRQHFIPMSGAIGTYICVPIALGWKEQRGEP